ncbi:MAG: leuS [Chlamydiales bacterium]|nr:leuS [Chlamydiales bacterium]
MDKKYDHHFIEPKWQKFWDEKKTFKSDVSSTKPKYYILDMFPYPSGAGLHVGHVSGYTTSDILARYYRQKGYNVLHPMGWDSFGLPAEQYAIRTGVHPAITTKKNVDNYRRQLKAVGFSYDWEREIATSDPNYYKWTQWIFTELYRKGLAYEAEMLVNYCPTLGTVVANEEIENGKTKEGGYPVERRPLKQWVLKITAYAERLIKDLDLVDWPENVRQLQKNWIGRSQGAKVSFCETSTQEQITVFTTRPDTLFGVSYVVLAPEHTLVDKITTPQQKEVVANYRKETSSKSDLDRTELNEEKTGVWTGAYAINPVNQKRIPIWISDYVLMNYGTGAVMGVPAHDERDFAFAHKFSLEITPVILPEEKDVTELGTYFSVDDLIEAVQQGKHCWTGAGLGYQCDNQRGLNLNGVSQPQVIEKTTHWLEQEGHGQRFVNYKLRDWLFSRQRYWGEPFPILHFKDGTKRVLDLDELPLCPPEVVDYKPSDSGESPLANVKEWVEIRDPKTGLPARRETNTMPQWAGSCWYYLRFCDPLNEKAAWGADTERYWMPVDMYLGGVEHAVLHLLYARFWHKVLYDCGHVSTPEPFLKYRYPGIVTSRSYRRPGGEYIDPSEVYEKDGSYFWKKNDEKLLSQVEKMSKSKLNGVTPDDIVEEFGADSLRLYTMFMGPLDKEKVWNTDAVTGCRRFLNRFYDMVNSPKVTNEETKEALKLGHRLVDGITKDLDTLQFNTAVSKMMEFINEFTSLSAYPKSVLKMAVQALSPFAPHMAEELWQQLGGAESVAYESWPTVDPQYLIDDVVTYVVQVNGKVRARLDLPAGKGEQEIVALATKDQNVNKFLTGDIKKVVFVPDKIVNLVV